MSKIVQAVNAMIGRKHLIYDVSKNEDELFFRYKDHYIWSMRRNDDGEYLLWFYPRAKSVSDVVDIEGPEWGTVPMVAYNGEEIGTKEAKASFADLYGILKEKLYGVSEVLDDIIADESE